MNAFRKTPIFASLMTVFVVVGLAELTLTYDRYAASRAAAKKLELRKLELQAMADLTPLPTRTVAMVIEADVTRAQRSLEAMQAELKGRGPAAERMRKTKLPAARTDAYFDLATFVEKTRELARKHEVDIRPEAARFGFSAYVNEGPELARISAVFHQRLIAEYLVEALLEAKPRALLSVQRERALTKEERETRDAAVAAAIAAGTPLEADNPAVSAGLEGPDFFNLDPRVSARTAGYIDTQAFRLVFIGQTDALRTFLNRLAGFELPVLVREVEVDPASAEETAPVASVVEEVVDTAGTEAASVVLSAEPPVPKKPVVRKLVARAPSTAPIVSKPLSKFTVTVEFIEVVPPPVEPAATGTTPTV